jgi:3'-phosphoadenosine 5'-phosphosulfate (PAPS) 3'-phosphatase
MIIQETPDRSSFLKRMSEAVLEAGTLARAMQGKVKNLAKKIDEKEVTTEVERHIRSAQTEIDIKSQEILIKASREVLDENTVLDAEEESPSVNLFKNTNQDLTLVLDPIDGTAEYLSNKDEYSICVGLIFKGKVISALVYYPNLDTLYYIDESGKGFIDKNHSKSHFKDSSKIDLSKVQHPTRVYLGNFSNKKESMVAWEKLIQA